MKTIQKNIFLATALTLLFLFSVLRIQAQDTTSISSESIIEERLEKLAGTTETDIDYTSIFEQLDYYRDHPMNLNSATRDEILSLGLMDEFHVNALLEHIRKYGKLINLYELQTIPGFDLETIFRILPFVRVNTSDGLGSIVWKEVLSKGNSMLLTRYQRALQRSIGDLPPDSTYPGRLNSHYLGSPDKYYARYRFTYKNNISFGLTGEKDAGETFFPKKVNTGTPNGILEDSLFRKYNLYKRGFDFYSAHLFMRTTGWLRALAVGDYEVKYGQGLTMWSGLAFGKTADVMNVKKYASGITPYTSVNENSFMRGGAAAFGYKNLQADVFYSSHHIDGNITSADTINDQIMAISSFETTGYHRTPAELDDRRSVQQSVIGSHVQYHSRKLQLGITGVETKFGSDLVRSYAPYNSFDFSGHENFNLGVDYSFFIKNLNFFGEEARSSNGGMAYLNGVFVSLDANLTVSVLNRNYKKDYQSLFNKGFGESAGTSNEKGTYFGINAKPMKAVTFAAYYDVFTFPWLNFSADRPSGGYDYLLQLTYTPSKKAEMYIRYSAQTKEENNPSTVNEPISTLVPVTQQHFRLNFNYKLNAAFSLGNRIELKTYHKEGNETSNGYMIYQDVNYKVNKVPLSLSFRYALFDTDDYNTVMSARESDLLYAYSFAYYYYRGSRFYLMAQYRVRRGVDVWIRYGETVYTNQSSVGSGYDEVSGNLKSEIKAQVRLSF